MAKHIFKFEFPILYQKEFECWWEDVADDIGLVEFHQSVEQNENKSAYRQILNKQYAEYIFEMENDYHIFHYALAIMAEAEPGFECKVSYINRSGPFEDVTHCWNFNADGVLTLLTENTTKYIVGNKPKDV